MNYKSRTILSIIMLVSFNIGQLNAQNTVKSNSLNSYSFDLYNEVKVEMNNLLLSPLSTYYALLAAYEGSKNTTKLEFEKVLHLNSSDLQNENYLQSLTGKLDNSNGLKVSNAIWVDKGFKAEEGYRKIVADKYFSDFRMTDFSNRELAVSDINHWVSEKTNQKVDKIVSADKLNSDTKLLITNAVYFKGEWLDKFEKKSTHPATFFAGIQDQYTVDFMRNKEILPYFENDEFQFISKPYASSGISFCILLPKELFDIEDIESRINSDFFDRILDSLAYTKVSLTVPKIKLESGFEISDILKKAGLTSAFTDDADFSGISKEKPLKLGKVLHKTWLEMDEEKTEAAAATMTNVIVGYGRLDAFKVFNADHPFMFFIMDNSKRAILFMGRYVAPAQGRKIIADQESLALKVENRKGDTFSKGDQNREVLFVVNGKIISQAESRAINPEDIVTINISTKMEEIRKYSPGDYNGVVVISLKNSK